MSGICPQPSTILLCCLCCQLPDFLTLEPINLQPQNIHLAGLLPICGHWSFFSVFYLLRCLPQYLRVFCLAMNTCSSVKCIHFISRSQALHLSLPQFPIDHTLTVLTWSLVNERSFIWTEFRDFVFPFQPKELKSFTKKKARLTVSQIAHHQTFSGWISSSFMVSKPGTTYQHSLNLFPQKQSGIKDLAFMEVHNMVVGTQQLSAN